MSDNHWHYQLMRHSTPQDETYYAIHEYFPVDDGPLWTENPVTVEGDSEADVIWMLKAILNDIEKHGVKNYDGDNGG